MTIESLKNLDLLSVGIAIAGILILGFIIFSNNRKSITNKTFLLFSVITVLWGIINYTNYQIDINPSLAFWLLRITIFLGIWHSFSFMQLAYVFPQERVKFPLKYIRIILPLVIVISIITLTPLVFKTVTELSPTGRILKVENGPAISLFALSVLASVISGIIILIKKTVKSRGLEKKQLGTILTGAGITFVLLMTFNFILPAFFGKPEFIPLGAVFLFPFIAFSFYAITKHKLLNIKVITTEVVTFILAVVVLFELILANDLVTRVLRFGVFSLVLAFGILLIKSVRIEVEEREKIEVLAKQLQDVNAKLDNLSRFKSQMLSLAAHQIKAPLATIKGFSTILIDGLYGPITDKVKETLKKIRFSSDDLINLINTLLDLRHVEEGKMDYNFQAVKIKDVATEAFEIIKFPAQQKNLQFTLDCSTEASVNADPQKLKQVLQNLIDNAVKYTPEGFVKVELKEEGGSVIFSVTDSGLGIPADLLPHLFDEEFVRDERVKKEILGTGLGLYIAKKIINDHRGEIGVKSDGPGKGSCFFVKLKKI